MTRGKVMVATASEQAIAGGLLYRPEAAEGLKLETTDFTDATARTVVSAILALRSRGEAVDASTVRAEAYAAGAHISIEDLNSLESAAPSTQSLPQHATRVRKAAERRRLASRMAMAAEDAADPSVTDERLAASVESIAVDLATTNATSLWVRGSAVVPRERRYIWRNRIRRGAFNLLEGLGKVGKSTLLRAIVAELTRMGIRVLWFSSEEDVAEDIVPALDAMNADLALVTFQDEGAATWATDRLAMLEEAIVADQIDLLVIDQVKDHLSSVKAKGENENTVRADLTELGRLARRTGVAIVGVRHWRKAVAGDAVSRGAGSGGYSAVARSILQVSKRPDGGLALATIGNGPPVPTLALSLVEADGFARVEWGGELDLDADDLAGFDACAQQHEDRSATRQAAAQIRRALANGPRASADVKRDLVARHGFTRRTIERAAGMAGIVVTRTTTGMAGIVVTRTTTVPPSTQWALAPEDTDQAHESLAPLAGLDRPPPAGPSSQTRQVSSVARLGGRVATGVSGQTRQARQPHARPCASAGREPGDDDPDAAGWGR